MQRLIEKDAPEIQRLQLAGSSSTVFAATVKPVLSGHPRGWCGVRLIRGVRLIQVSIYDII